MKLNKFIPVLAILLSVIVFFYPFVLKQQLPIPSDTIVGLYYPFRDLYAQTNPNGLPYKNFLITDPVRQQYPWKNLVINLEKQGKLPLWNPYSFAGTPLLSNFQSSSFYPLNLLLFIQPFSFFWSIFILLQPLLLGLFIYLYLRNLKLDYRAALLGALTWMFCGFSIAWLEWGVILHTILWLPLILLSIDKILAEKKVQRKTKNIWFFVFTLAISSSFLAGHLQSFFYVGIFVGVYIIARLIQQRSKIKNILQLLICFVIFVLLTFFQWFPTLQFIVLSNRSFDQIWTQPGWFIPYQNLVQFMAPDFFGNPATLNYWGVWNYAEFIGYIGIGSFIFAIYAILFRRDKKTLLFFASFTASLFLALQNPISQMPFSMHIPFLSTAQPTRLLSILCFSLAVLSALGLDLFIKSGKTKRIFVSTFISGFILVVLWSLVFLGVSIFGSAQNIDIAKNNLKLPTILFGIFAILIACLVFLKNKKIKNGLYLAFIIFVLFDLFRFGWKFTPFTNQEYLFPSTKIIEFLQKQPGVFRIAATDSRILPPNFSVMYKLQSIEGYDPLYLKNYAAFIAAMERGKPDISEPYGFNRIITPRNYNYKLYDLLNVEYVLSFDKLPEWKFTKVFSDGKISIYKNRQVLPRAFFVSWIQKWENDDSEIQGVFDSNLALNAVVEGYETHRIQMAYGNATIIYYSENKIVIKADVTGEGFLVLTDSYYPTWRAKVDGKLTKIYRTDFAFRGILVPKGQHIITFEIKPF